MNHSCISSCTPLELHSQQWAHLHVVPPNSITTLTSRRILHATTQLYLNKNRKKAIIPSNLSRSLADFLRQYWTSIKHEFLNYLQKFYAGDTIQS